MVNGYLIYRVFRLNLTDLLGRIKSAWQVQNLMNIYKNEYTKRVHYFLMIPFTISINYSLNPTSQSGANLEAKQWDW